MITYLPFIQKAVLPNDYSIDVLRLDKIHPEISGNKWFKLKNNIAAAIQQNKKKVLTFGGAHSNHLAATAAACKIYGLHVIAIVRGEDDVRHNETLIKAEAEGMQIEWITRAEYRQKTTTAFIDNLRQKFGDFYLIPEGGNNDEGILGCMEILAPLPLYDFVFCACGSGATFSGLVAGAKRQTQIVGFSVLKGENTLAKSVEEKLNQLFPAKQFEVNETFSPETNTSPFSLINQYAFSGFAKYDAFLVDFKKTFEAKNDITLDYLYTSKLMYGIDDLLVKKQIKKEAKILAIHSGGLQGNKAFEQRYGIVP